MSGMAFKIQEEWESNVERDGIIIWILRSRESSGMKVNRCFCILLIGLWGIDGLRLLSVLMEELIMGSKIIGTPPWRKDMVKYMKDIKESGRNGKGRCKLLLKGTKLIYSCWKSSKNHRILKNLVILRKRILPWANKK